MKWFTKCPVGKDVVVEKAEIMLNEKGDKISPNYVYIIKNVLRYGLNLKSRNLNNFYLVYLNNLLDQALSA